MCSPTHSHQTQVHRPTERPTHPPPVAFFIRSARFTSLLPPRQFTFALTPHTSPHSFVKFRFVVVWLCIVLHFLFRIVNHTSYAVSLIRILSRPFLLLLRFYDCRCCAFNTFIYICGVIAAQIIFFASLICLLYLVSRLPPRVAVPSCSHCSPYLSKSFQSNIFIYSFIPFSSIVAAVASCVSVILVCIFIISFSAV